MAESIYKPFTVLILNPEGATIEDSFKSAADSIEFEFRDMYFDMVREFESEVKAKRRGPKRKEAEEKLQNALSHETEAYDFKYYKLPSISAYVSIIESFNLLGRAEPPASCEIGEIWQMPSSDFSTIAEFAEADYVVSFQNLASKRENGNLILTMTLQVYSNAESKLIVNKELRGERNEIGCTMKSNDLMCLLENLIRSSDAELISVLLEKQVRR